MKNLNIKVIVAFIALVFILLIPNFSNAAKVSVNKVKNLQVTANETNLIKLKWSKVTKATKYQVYTYDYNKGEYVYKASTTKTSINITKLTSATKYKYKVRAYRKVNGKKYHGSFSSVIVTGTKPDGVKNLKVDLRKDTKLSISWDKVPRATAYRIYIIKPGKDSFEYYGNSTTNSIELKNLISASTYKFRVRAYKKINGTKYLRSLFWNSNNSNKPIYSSKLKNERK